MLQVGMQVDINEAFRRIWWAEEMLAQKSPMLIKAIDDYIHVSFRKKEKNGNVIDTYYKFNKHNFFEHFRRKAVIKVNTRKLY